MCGHLMTLVQYDPRLLVPEVMARRFDIQPWRRLTGGHKRGDALSSHLAMGRRVIKSHIHRHVLIHSYLRYDHNNIFEYVPMEVGT